MIACTQSSFDEKTSVANLVNFTIGLPCPYLMFAEENKALQEQGDK
jgi:hypothetical protein